MEGEKPEANMTFIALQVQIGAVVVAQCYRQWLFKDPICITLKIKIWVVAYFFNFFKLFQKKIKL